MGRVRRNKRRNTHRAYGVVTPRMGRVSRNHMLAVPCNLDLGHAPHGACE